MQTQQSFKRISILKEGGGTHSTSTTDKLMGSSEKLEIRITPGAWFRQDLLFPIFGLSTEAVRKYRSKGLWLEGKHWRWDPANVIVYNQVAIERWMEGKP